MPTFPTSQTFKQLTTSTLTLVDRAYGALKLRPQQITAEMIDIALALLLQIQSHLVNQSAPLWTLQKVLIPLVQGQAQYNLGASTVDIAQNGAFFRLMQNQTGNATRTYTPAAYNIAFPAGSPFGISTLQMSWPAGSTGFGLTVQSSPDNATWTTVYTTTIYDASSGNVFLDLSNNAAAQFFQVIPTVNTNTLPAGFAVSVYNTPQEIQMARLNKDDYWNMTNKAFPGRPLQWWMDRQIQPVMNLWPTPDLTSSQNVMVIWRHRYLMDPGSLQQSIEFPPRWYFTVIYLLAAELAYCTPEVDPQIIPQIQAKADSMVRQAWLEERDASPIKFNLGLRQYTRA